MKRKYTLFSIIFMHLMTFFVTSSAFPDGEPLQIAVILDDSLSMLEKTLHKKDSSIEPIRKIDLLKNEMSRWVQSRLEKGDRIYLTGLVPRQWHDKEVLITDEMRYWQKDSKFVTYPAESIGKTTVVREYSRDAIAGTLTADMRLISSDSEIATAMKELAPYMDITPLGYSLYEVSRWLNSNTSEDQKPHLRVLAVTDGIDYFGAENTCENIRRIEQEGLLLKQQISLHLIYFLPNDADNEKENDDPVKKLLDDARRIEKDYLTTVLACTKGMRDWVRVDVIDEQSNLKEVIESEILEPKTEKATDDSEKKDNIIEIFNEDIEDMEKFVDKKEITLEELKKEIQDIDLKPIAGSTLNYIKDQNLFFTIAPDEESMEQDKEKELIFFSLKETETDNFSLFPRATVSIPSLKYQWKDEYGRKITEYKYMIFNDIPYLVLEGKDLEDKVKSTWINLLSFTLSEQRDLKSDDKTTYAHILPQSNDLALLVQPNSFDEPWYYLQVPAGSYSYSTMIYSHGSESYRELKIDENAAVQISELPPLPEEFRNLDTYEPKFEFSGPATYDIFCDRLACHIALDLMTKKWIKKNTFDSVLAHSESLGITPQIDLSDFMDSNEMSSIRIKFQDDDKLFQGYLIQFDKIKPSSDGFVKYEQFIEIDILKEKRDPIQYQEYMKTNLLFGFTPHVLFILEKPTDMNSLSVSVYNRGHHHKALIDYTPYFKMVSDDTKLTRIDFGALNDKLILDLEYDAKISRIVYDMIKKEVIEDDSEYRDIDLSDLRSSSGVSGASVSAEFPDKNANKRAISVTSSTHIPNLNAHLNGGRRIEAPLHAILDRYFHDVVHYEKLHPEFKGKLDENIFSIDDEDIPFRVNGISASEKSMLPTINATAFHFYRLNDEQLKPKPYVLLHFSIDGKSYYGFLKRTYVEKFVIIPS